MKIKLIEFRAGAEPIRKHYNDAGADVAMPIGMEFPPHLTVTVPLGFGLELPDGLAGYIFPRSSMAAMGLVCELPPIDSGYRGEVHAIVTNMSDAPLYLAPGTRVGQLVIMPCVLADFVHETETERACGAFGSTGR